MLTRRTALAVPALALARPARAAGRSLNLVLESEAVILDPYATTAAITRSFGHHVFDTLFATDAAGVVQPQMVEAWETSADRLAWRFTLRPGLAWHDGGQLRRRIAWRASGGGCRRTRWAGCWRRRWSAWRRWTRAVSRSG